MNSFRRLTLLLLALSIAGSAFYLRLRPRPDVSSPEEAVVPPPLPTATATAPDARPTRAQVGPVVERVFGGGVTPDERGASWFAIGDFDGDAATDLAVAVRPTDAAAGAAPGALAGGERLLAIVHGVTGASWSDATVERPGYLVRHAAGSELRARPLAGLPAEIRMRVTRAHVGDVLAARRDGRHGFVFWNGAGYVSADLPDDGAAAVRGGGRSNPP